MRWTLLAAALAGCAPAAVGQQLYFADVFSPTLADGLIQRVNVDGTGLEPVVTVGGGLRSLDVDAAAGKVYWCDVDNFVVRRANLDGSGVEDMISTGLQFPNAVRVEMPAGRLWVGDASAEMIGFTTSLDPGNSLLPWMGTPFYRGLSVENGDILHTTSLSPTSGNLLRTPFAGLPASLVTMSGKPQSIAVDRVHGRVYFTDAAQRSVRAVDLSGGVVQTLYTHPAGYPVHGIAVDPAGGKVYWGEDQSDEPPVFRAIMRMNLDGTGVEPLVLGVGAATDMVFVGGPPTCYANCDGSTTAPVLNVADFTCFLNRFAAGESYANCDGSTTAPVLNVADFTCFLQSFAGGCP